MYTWLAYREQKHQLHSVDIDRRICNSSINHRHHFFCDLLSNISGKFQSISLCRSFLYMLYTIYTKVSVYLLFYSYAYSSHLMNCAAHRSKETKKLFNWFWPWTYHICFAGLHTQLYVFYAYLSQKGNNENKLSCCDIKIKILLDKSTENLN